MAASAKNLQVLEDLVARLRAPDGCPWDREQGFADLRAYLLEEAHEVAAALDREDWQNLTVELGDLLFQIAFLGRLSEEAGHPGLDESIAKVREKMIERHPHVFGDVEAADRHEVAAQWERRKLRGRAPGSSLLDGMSDSLPSLLAAYRMTQKASGVGFDWSSPSEVLEKVEEELDELRHAIAHDSGAAREEIGDLLFTVANLARHLDEDPEAALARANLKFRRRFGHMEKALAQRGRSLADASLDELDALWEEAKRGEGDPVADD